MTHENPAIAHLFAGSTAAPLSNTKVTTEAIRIKNLPVYQYVERDFTDQVKTADGEMRLRPLQNKALAHCVDARGGVLLLGCGVGKTLISFLLPTVLKAKRPLLLVPAALVAKTKAEFFSYEKHFKITLPEVFSYEKLSRRTAQQYLTKLNPDLIIADEAHHLKSMDSTRTGRLGKYLVANPTCSFIVMSGTLFSKSLGDFAHLSDWALEEGSPVPNNHRDVECFDAVLTGEANHYQHADFAPLLTWGTSPRDAVYKRLAATKGVVLTSEDDVGSSLQILTMKLSVPEDLQKAINDCFETGLMSDVLGGLEVDFDADAINASQHLWDDVDQFALRGLGQMLSGCLYYWEWPNNEPDEEWLNARKEWRRAVRIIREMDLEGFDSPHIIEMEWDNLPFDIQEAFDKAYREWQQVKYRAEPPRHTVWVSDYMIKGVKSWFEKQTEPSIIWVESVALGQRLEQELGLPYHGGGTEIPAHAHNCIASIDSHGTGKNLQAWANCLVVAPMADPARWEQLIARTHRTGQMADVVKWHIFNHSIFGSAFAKARKQAKVISDVSGQAQRLTYADYITGEKL